jgi:fructokinase
MMSSTRMEDRSPLILAIGEILWDLFPAGKQLGGAPANFAWHAAQLGVDARIATAVGEDDLGREILATLGARRADTSLITRDAIHPTGTVTVSLSGSGQPAYTIHENVAWDFIPSSAALLDLARRADCICFGTLAQRSPQTRRTIAEVLAVSRPAALRIFDINLRQRYYDRGTIFASLDAASVLKINVDELPVLCGLLALPTSLSDILRRFENLRLVALTSGASGSLVVDRDGQFDHPGYPIDYTQHADTVGAGDAFTAALAVGLLRGQGLASISERANRLAAYVCTRPGATPAIPADLLASLAY